MTKLPASGVLILVVSNLLAAQTLTTEHNVLRRRYREGEKLTYRMTGINERWHYEIQADGIVKKDLAGTYFEEYRWSNLISDGQQVELPAASLDFRQQLTLDPNRHSVFPNLSRIDRRLVGPVTDLMNLYVDLWLAEKTGKLAHAGDHFYLKHGKPNSWADGSYVLVGEDSIDFDLSLMDINQSENTVIVRIHHVPPEKPEVQLPADWMRKPVADTANNWVQVQKMENGKYSAAVGKETFDVEIKASLTDGKILSGKIDNPVETLGRECTDAALTECGAPKPHSMRRQIAIHLEP